MGQPSDALMGENMEDRVAWVLSVLPGIFPGSEASEQQDTGRALWDEALKNVLRVPLWTGAKDTGQRTNTESQPHPRHVLHCRSAGSFESHQRRHVLGHTGSPRRTAPGSPSRPGKLCRMAHSAMPLGSCEEKAGVLW